MNNNMYDEYNKDNTYMNSNNINNNNSLYTNSNNMNNSVYVNSNNKNKKKKNPLKIVTTVLGVFIFLFLVGFGLVYTGVIKINYVAPKSILLSRGNVALKSGREYQLDYQLYPETTSEKNVYFESSDPSVMEVNEVTGYVTAKKEGEAYVVIKSKNDNSVVDSTKVVVADTLVPAEQIVLSSEKLVFDLSNVSSKLLKVSIEPENASNKKFDFYSGDDSIAVVDENGYVTPVGFGRTKINVTTKDGSLKASCEVVVTDSKNKQVYFEDVDNKKIVYPYAIELETNYLRLKPETSRKVGFTLLPPDVTEDVVSWISADSKIATVKDGVVEGKTIGTTTITAITVNDLVAKLTVEVTNEESEITILEARENEMILDKGERDNLDIRYDSLATNNELTYKSNDESIVTVSDTGEVKAVGTGMTEVVVSSSNGLSTEVVVKVNSGPDDTVPEIDDTTLKISSGQTLELPTTNQNGEEVNAVYITSDDSVLEVDSKTGLISGELNGNTTITVETSDGVNIPYSVVVEETKVTRIDITNYKENILQGDKINLEYNVYPVNATNKNITWTSSDPNIATVSDTGEVNALKLGSVDITVTSVSNSNAYRTVSINVVKENSSVLEAEIKAINETTETDINNIIDIISAFVKINDLDVSKINSSLKENGLNSKFNKFVLTYDSNNKKVKIDSSSKNSESVKIPDDASNFYVTLYDQNNKEIKKSKIEILPYRIDINDYSKEVKKGYCEKLNLSFTPAYSTNKNVKYESSDLSVAVVSSTGEVCYKKEGNVVITVTSSANLTSTTDYSSNKKQKNEFNNINATAISDTKLFNENDKVASYIDNASSSTTRNINVNVVNEPANNNKKQTTKLENTDNDKKAKNAYAEGLYKAIGSFFKFFSQDNDETIDEVENNTTIPVKSISITTKPISMNTNGEAKIKYTINPDNATNKAVKFESSDSSVIAVYNDGKIEAKKEGTATITISSANDSNIKTSINVTVNKKSSDTTTESTTEGILEEQDKKNIGDTATNFYNGIKTTTLLVGEIIDALEIKLNENGNNVEVSTKASTVEELEEIGVSIKSSESDSSTTSFDVDLGSLPEEDDKEKSWASEAEISDDKNKEIYNVVMDSIGKKEYSTDDDVKLKSDILNIRMYFYKKIDTDFYVGETYKCPSKFVNNSNSIDIDKANKTFSLICFEEKANTLIVTDYTGTSKNPVGCKIKSVTSGSQNFYQPKDEKGNYLNYAPHYTQIVTFTTENCTSDDFKTYASGGAKIKTQNFYETSQKYDVNLDVETSHIDVASLCLSVNGRDKNDGICFKPDMYADSFKDVVKEIKLKSNETEISDKNKTLKIKTNLKINNNSNFIEYNDNLYSMIQFSSLNPNILTVDENGNVELVKQPIQDTIVIIKAIAKRKPFISDTIKFTVKGKYENCEKIDLETKKIDDNKYSLTTYCKNGNDSTIIDAGAVSYTSNNKNVTIDSGYAICKDCDKTPNVKITAKLNNTNLLDFETISFGTSKKYTDFRVNLNSYELNNKSITYLSIEFKNNGDDNWIKDSNENKNIIYESENPSIVSINSDGRMEAKNNSDKDVKVKIKVKSSTLKKENEFTVTVKAGKKKEEKKYICYKYRKMTGYSCNQNDYYLLNSYCYRVVSYKVYNNMSEDEKNKYKSQSINGNKLTPKLYYKVHLSRTKHNALKNYSNDFYWTNIYSVAKNTNTYYWGKYSCSRSCDTTNNICNSIS